MTPQCSRWARWRPRLARGPGGRGLPRDSVRPAMAFCISPWTKLHCYQQPDEGVRAERHPLWMDTGAAGAGATDVAGCRLHVRKPGASSGAACGDCARQPRSHSQSRPLVAGDESFASQCVPGGTSGTRLRAEPVRHHCVSEAESGHLQQILSTCCAMSSKRVWCPAAFSSSRNISALDFAGLPRQ